MLATPVIGLAAALKVPTLFKPAARPMLAMTALSALVAGICAYLSTQVPDALFPALTGWRRSDGIASFSEFSRW